MSDESTEAPQQETPDGGDGDAAAAGEPTAEEKQWGMFTHLSPLLGFLIPVPFVAIIVPLIIWQMKKESDFIAHAGKEAINFQITLLIALVISGLLMFALIGFVLFPVVAIAGLVFIIIAGIKSNEGERYKFPYCLRLVK